jgi:CHAT domain-containing protein/tetratricopeptide (TPR) repeat protein
VNTKLTSLILPLLCGFFAISILQAENRVATESELDSAIALYRAEGAEKALPEFERLHALFAEADDRLNASKAERYIGESHWQLGNYEPSRVFLDRALGHMRELGQGLDEGKILNVLGLLEWDLGNYELAIDNFEQASLIGSELGDKRLAGSTMNNLSLVYDELGDYQTSLKQYRQALDLYKGIDFPRGESDTLGNIGGVNLLLGRYKDALAYYQRALAISEVLKSKPSMSLDHGNLALCYLGLGQIDKALEHFDLALELARETGMRKEEALWQRGKGNALIRKGQYDLGLENHRAALKAYEETNARNLLLDALHDMGLLHLTLGDPVSAEQYFQRGIQMARDIGHARAITINLLALGDLQFNREHFEEADALYRQALQRATNAGELNYQTESLLRLSLVHREQQQFSEAHAEARQALALAEKIDAGFAQAEAWFASGELARLQGKTDAALESYTAAQEVSGVNTDPDLLWQIHYGRARAQIELDHRQAAVVELKAAVKIIESARERLREERFKAGYVQDKYKVYVDLVRLQLELGLTQQAFSTAERLRSRSFLDQLENNAPLSRNEQERQDEYALRERVRQLQSAMAEEQDLTPSDRRQLAVDTFSRELLAAERDYQAFLDDLKGRSAVGRAARIPALAEVQSRLKPGEALVEYVVGEERLMIFVMQQNKLTAVIKELRNTNLFAKVNLVRELIQDPSNNSWWAPAASLSDSLLKPLRDENLLEGVNHLYLVPHGILNYLPFALLPLDSAVDEQVMMEQYTFNYLPAAATLVQVMQQKRTSKSLLAMAPSNARLRYAIEEAQSITDLYQADSLLLTGMGATESAFKSQASGYGILHLSTHGYFNARNPLFSGLELEPDEANDGRLEVHEILGLSLDADLVTLSACETGMGSGYFNEIPSGDEFVSLTRAFLLAGSRSVLATLWEVDDHSTVLLMEGFYRRLDPSGDANDQANALAQIQREFRKSNSYKHPFYWAAFVLVGQQNRGAGAQI